MNQQSPDVRSQSSRTAQWNWNNFVAAEINGTAEPYQRQRDNESNSTSKFNSI